MKILSVLFFPLLSIFYFNTQVKHDVSNNFDNKIIWEGDSRLNWKDFSGSANNFVFYHAYSMTGIAYDVLTNSPKSAQFFIYSYFDKNQSWVKNGQETDYLLNHEQMHFDLCELYRRKFAKRLTDRTFTHQNISSEMKIIFDDIFRGFEQIQKQYDAETNHARIKEKQKEWNAFVQAELLKYQQYSIPMVEVMYE